MANSVKFYIIRAKLIKKMLVSNKDGIAQFSKMCSYESVVLEHYSNAK